MAGWRGLGTRRARVLGFGEAEKKVPLATDFFCLVARMKVQSLEVVPRPVDHQAAATKKPAAAAALPAAKLDV